jgi:hypothetical protein
MDNATKEDLCEVLLALIALNLGDCDEPPNLRQVIEHCDPVLRIRGSRLLSARLAADKRKAPKLIRQLEREADRIHSDHLATLIARQRFILDS